MNCHKISIDEALSQCKYDPYIQSELSQNLKQYYSDINCYQFYLYTSQAQNHKIIVMKSKFEIHLHSVTRNIDIIIYFVKGYPDQPPLLYIDKQPNTALNPLSSFYINITTYQINFDMFLNWGKTFDSLRELLNEVKKQFSINFPLIVCNDSYNSISIIEQSMYFIEVDLYNQNIDKDKENKQKEYKYVKTKKEAINEEENMITKTLTFQQYYSRVNTIPNESIILKAKSNRFKRKCLDLKLTDDDNNANYDITKKELINSIMNKTKDKVIIKTKHYAKTIQRIEKFMGYLNSQIHKLTPIINKENEIMEMLEIYKTESQNYKFNSNYIDKLDKNLSNIDKIIKINNKALLTNIAKVKSIEEYLSFIRKAIEYNTIILSEAIKEYRNSSIILFKLKYHKFQCEWK